MTPPRPRPDRAPEAAGGQRQPASTRRQSAHARGHAGVGALAARAGRGRTVRQRPAAPQPRLRPVGRDQQLIEFERPLSRREAASLREKLMARPDVEWVEPNLRERRLQVPPNDPLFAQQWWLQPVERQQRQCRSTPGCAAWPASRPPGCAPTMRRRWWRCSTPASPATPTWPAACLPGYDFVSVHRIRQRRRRPRRRRQRPGRLCQRGRPRPAACSPAAPSRTVPGTAPSSPAWSRPTPTTARAAPASTGAHRPAGARGRQVRRRRDRHHRRHALGRRPGGRRRAALNPNPARIINISFGGSAACGPAYQSAVDELRAIGVVVVAAAGNEWRRARRARPVAPAWSASSASTATASRPTTPTSAARSASAALPRWPATTPRAPGARCWPTAAW